MLNYGSIQFRVMILKQRLQLFSDTGTVDFWNPNETDVLSNM